MTIYVNRTPVVTAVGSIAELHAELGLQQMVAIAQAKRYVTQAISEGSNKAIGHGHGPTMAYGGKIKKRVATKATLLLYLLRNLTTDIYRYIIWIILCNPGH
jgi:hypothetical protein